MNTGKLYTILLDNQNNIKLFLGCLVFTLVLSGYAQTVLINTCIVTYLTYKTMKHLKEGDQSDSEMARSNLELLKQWTTFSFLIVAEYFLSMVFNIFLMSIFYNAIKIVGLVLLLQNSDNLALVYNLVLIPLFEKYESSMDMFFELLQSRVHEFRQVSQDNRDYNVLSKFESLMPHVFGKKKKSE